MLKSEASLTGFAVSPRIARTLQRCENFTCARVFPTSISHLPFPSTRCTFFLPSSRTNSAFNCARRANDIFLLLLCLRSHRIFRFNKIPRSHRGSTERYEEIGPGGSELYRTLRNLILEKIYRCSQIWKYSWKNCDSIALRKPNDRGFNLKKKEAV